jgi:hypothetical protein
VNERPTEPPLIRPLTPIQALCLDCTLPDCDETDPRCAYQQATGRRARRLARLRAYMRRRKETLRRRNETLQRRKETIRRKKETLRRRKETPQRSHRRGIP